MVARSLGEPAPRSFALELTDVAAEFTPPGREATVYEGEDQSWRYSPIDRITCA